MSMHQVTSVCRSVQVEGFKENLLDQRYLMKAFSVAEEIGYISSFTSTVMYFFSSLQIISAASFQSEKRLRRQTSEGFHEPMP